MGLQMCLISVVMTNIICWEKKKNWVIRSFLKVKIIEVKIVNWHGKCVAKEAVDPYESFPG